MIGPFIGAIIVFVVAVTTSEIITDQPNLDGIRDKLEEAASIEYDFNTPPQLTERAAGITWLPDRGLRGLFIDFRLTPGLIESLVGEKMYVKGPHGDAFQFNDRHAFGHYNPAFVRKLIALQDRIAENPELFVMANQFFQIRLFDMLTAYLHVETIVNAPENAQLIEETIALYEQHMQDGSLDNRKFGRFPYDVQYHLTAKLEQQGYDPYEAITAAGFWIRRRMDGTAPLFKQLLLKTRQYFIDEVYD